MDLTKNIKKGERGKGGGITEKDEEKNEKEPEYGHFKLGFVI